MLNSCGDNYYDEKVENTDSSLLYGEWVTMNSTFNHYSEISLNNRNRAIITVVQNAIGNDGCSVNDEGAWTQDAMQNLSFSMIKSSIPKQKIIDLSDSTMVLQNLVTHITDTYHRVVETIEIYAGQECFVNYLKEHNDFNPINIFSSNRDVVNVDPDGKIKAHQGGIAYIIIQSSLKTVYVKIKVCSRIDRYAEETHMTIDEIYMIHGRPDMDVYKTDTINSIMYYNPTTDSEIEYLGYDYDIFTHEIKQIETIYKSEDTYNSDSLYIKRYYKENNRLTWMYGESEYMSECNYVIAPHVGDDPYVKYYNADYNAYDTEWDWYADITIPKDNPKELYMEPYKEWGGSVSDVKSYMSNYSIFYDIQPYGSDYAMVFMGNDLNGHKMYYEYYFGSQFSDLYRIKVYLNPKFVTYKDVRAHLVASGLRYLYTNADAPGGVFVSDVVDGIYTMAYVSTYDESIVVTYLMIDYNAPIP